MGSIRITNKTNEDLTNDDTNDFKVSDRKGPLLVADLVGLPALRPDSREKWRQVTDGEKDVSIRRTLATRAVQVRELHTPRDPNLPQVGRRS
jgi:hypothetical protein